MKKKKVIAIWILAAIVLAGVIGCCLWQYLLPRFHDVSVELGTSRVGVDHFLTIHGKQGRASFVTDMKAIDWSVTQQTPITLRHGIKQETVMLTVRDTTDPKVEFIKDRTIGLDDSIRAEDFVLSAEDLSGVAISFKEPPASSPDYSDITVTAVVTDGSGNSVEQKCNLSYSWLRPQVTLELGQILTKEQVLMDHKKDGHLVDQTRLDAIAASPVGEYTLTSTAGSQTRTCTVTVRDTTGPEFTLKPVQVYQGDELNAQSLVASASDLSGEVTVQFARQPDTDTLGTQTVTVEAKDSHGNVSKAEVQIEVIADTEAPVINFSGSLTLGKNSDPDYLKGVSAYDAHDGVCEVTCDASAVDLGKAGTYKIVYTAKDAAGNAAQKKRDVMVNPDKADTDALVKQIAATLSDDVQEIRNYVREITYTHNWGGEDPAWFGFTKGHGNCYVHALCLQALLEEKGYETQLIWVRGSAPGEDKTAYGEDPHYWVIVKLDGQWKHLDATPGPTHTKYDEPMNDTMRLDCLKGRTWDISRWPACP